MNFRIVTSYFILYYVYGYSLHTTMGEQIKEGETSVFCSQLSKKLGSGNEKKRFNLSYSDSYDNFKN